MPYKYLTFSIDGDVATIVLDRADAGNTFNIELAEELESVARACAMDQSIGAVILTGKGKLFSGGGDLAYMMDNMDSLDVAIKALADRLHSAYSMFVRMKAPLIVAVNGTAAGIGLSLALLGDMTIAVEKAKFVASYTNVGLSPDGGLTHSLPRLIGPKRASEMILTNRLLSAAEAEEWGMINKVVPQEDLMDEVQNLAKKLASGPSNAFGDAKRLLANSFNESLESQMHLEGLALASNAGSVNGKEGILAFSNNTQPVFTKS